MDNPTENSKITVTFAAIKPYLESHVVKPVEVQQAGRDWVAWGKDNTYPDYVDGLRREAATLRSVIDGVTDYVVGDRVDGVALVGDKYVNGDRDTWRDFIKALGYDYATFGGFAFEVIRNEAGQVAELYWIDFRYLRTNRTRDVFWYSEDWSKRWGKKKDLVIPGFLPDAFGVASSIVYYTGSRRQVYPECPFGAAVIAAELERAIDEYHWNTMNNGFTGSYIVNFNNGNPPDEVKDEIEAQFNKKFSGHQNAGRIMFSWNPSKEAMTTLQEMKTSDFADKYDALAKRCRQQLFTAYRANPNLFGIPTDNLGFSSEEYESAFKLFNRTVVQPMQAAILAAIAYVGDWGLNITPFTLEGPAENKETADTAGEGGTK